MDSPKTPLSRKSSSTTSIGSSSSEEFEYSCPKEELIQNHDKLLALFERIEGEEFPELLFRLFEAHGKLRELFSCAIEKELALFDTADKFQLSTNSHLYQLLLLLIHNDFGRKYMQLALIPMIKKCVAYFQEIEKPDEEIFSNSTLIEFLSDLIKYAERCPITFQEALTQLKEAFERKFPSAVSQVLPRVLCVNFVHDILENPLDFVGDTKEIDLETSKFCANIYKQLAKLLKDEEFLVTSPFPLILYKKLTDPSTVETLKELVDSNIIINVEKLRQEAEIAMYNFLKSGSLYRSMKDQLLYEEANKRFNSVYNDKDGWVPGKGSKGRNIQLWSKKCDWSRLLVWKVETTFKSNLASVYSAIFDCVEMGKLDKRLSLFKEMASKNIEKRRDFYARTMASFPVAARDLRYARYDFPAEKEARGLWYSVEDPDIPKFPKVVRMWVHFAGYVMKANEANNEVLYTYIAQVDPSGNLPLWMVNKWSAGFVEEIKRLQTVVNKTN